MKTIGVRALKDNPGLLSRSADSGELVLLTNRNNPISLSVPFTPELLETGVGVNLAIKLFEEEVLTLSKAAKLADMPVERFIALLGRLGVDVADLTADELAADLNVIYG